MAHRTATDEPAQYLTVAEVADHYRVATSTVRRWVLAGVLDAVRIGGTVRVRADSLPTTSTEHASPA